MLGRVRWFRGSGEVQTEHSHPIMGTPVEVPDPRKTSRRVGAPADSLNLTPSPILTALNIRRQLWGSIIRYSALDRDHISVRKEAKQA